jgi:hypothetical protein
MCQLAHLQTEKELEGVALATERQSASDPDSNQRASSMLLRLLAIAASVPPRETQVGVKHRGPSLCAPVLQAYVKSD